MVTATSRPPMAIEAAPSHTGDPVSWRELDRTDEDVCGASNEHRSA
jgi:hypothetical protein